VKILLSSYGCKSKENQGDRKKNCYKNYKACLIQETGFIVLKLVAEPWMSFAITDPQEIG